MQRIKPHLWFDKDAAAAVPAYLSAFPGSRLVSQVRLHGTPSGEVDLFTVSLSGYEVMILVAGPEFQVNPSLSFLVPVGEGAQVDALHALLSKGGSDLMPLGAYPFSPRYAWTMDRHGVSWQLMEAPQGPGPQSLVPAQMFVGANCGRGQEALEFYTSVFGGRILEVTRYGEGAEPDKPEHISHGAFELLGQRFALMDSGYPHAFAFSEALSYVVECRNQEEIDAYWKALSAQPEAEACGWLKDKFGFSWQIVPAGMENYLGEDDPARAARVTEAFLGMRKFDLGALEKAARG